MENSRYVSNSTKTQATQTLPVQTQPPTQLMSHEVHQFTQLINHDSVDHVPGDTLVDDSDLERSRDTIVLQDDDGNDDAVQSAHTVTDKGGAALCSNDDVAHQEAIDSDATTEEGDAEDFTHLETDAEFPPLHFDTIGDHGGVKTEDKPSEAVHARLPGFANVCDTTHVASMKTPLSASVADVNGRPVSGSRPRSIASVRAASLRASGIRASSQSASMGSAGRDDKKYDNSEATVELNNETEKSLEVGLQSTGNHASKTPELDSMQASPKATLPFESTGTRSPRMSTSRSKSQSVSPVDASLQDDPKPLEQANRDAHATIELNTSMVLEKPKISNEHVESISTLLEPRSAGLKRLRSQTSSHDHDVVDNEGARSDGSKVQSRQLSGQKARKLVFDSKETSPTTSTDKLEDGNQSKVSRVLHAGEVKPVNVIHRGEHHALSFRATNLSYIESQEPGEESQLNALNIVDKLVWLDATCTSDDIGGTTVPETGSVQVEPGAKGLKSLAQAAQMKTVRDKLDVFDWEDSQADEAVSPDTTRGCDNSKARKLPRKRPSGVSNLSTGRKKQTTSLQKAESISRMDKKGNNLAGLEKGLNSSAGEQAVVSSTVPPSGDEVIKPHALLTSRLKKTTKAEVVPSSKGRKSPSVKNEPRKRGAQKKPDSSVKNEPRKRGAQKKPDDESGKDFKTPLETTQQQGRLNKERKVQHANKLSLKGEGEPHKMSEAGCKIEEAADRTSQDDAAADIWIEAFTDTKTKTPNSSEVIKFKKRTALHEDTVPDAKKSRVSNVATVASEEHLAIINEKNLLEQETMKKGPKMQQSPKKFDATTTSQFKGRRVSTRSSQGELDVTCKNSTEDLMDTQPKSKQNLKKTRASRREHQDAEENQTDKAVGPKTRQDSNKREIIDQGTLSQGRSASIPGKSGHVQDAMEKDTGKGDRSTWLKALKRTAAGCNMHEGKKSRTEVTADQDLSKGEMQVGLDVEKPSTKTSTWKAKRKAVTHPQSAVTTSPGPQQKELEQDMTRSSVLVPATTPIEGKAAVGPNRRKGRGQAAGAGAEPATAVKSSKVLDSEKSSPQVKELGLRSKKNLQAVVSREQEATVLRRTRGSTFDSSQKKDSVGVKKEGVQSCRESNHATEEQIMGNKSDVLKTDEDLNKQVAVSATKTTNSILRRNKKSLALETLEKLSGSTLVEEGRRRKRESSCIRVLFSHSLTEDMIKQQRKILVKLGGQLSTTASDCTHFISNVFVRTRNMLISMAAGKVVATPQWLESCGQAHYFVDEKNHILKDEKKERELGFSMLSSLDAARRKPLLKGIKVLICANTVPEPTVMKTIVESAGGQVIDTSEVEQNDSLFVIIANEKDYEFCLQFLDKGLEVYSEELILHGIVTQTLDFSRNHLFKDHGRRKGGRRRASKDA